MNQTERQGREMTHGERYTHLGNILRTTNKLIDGGRYFGRTKDELKLVRSEIIAERADLWDAIQFRVPDDCEGI